MASGMVTTQATAMRPSTTMLTLPVAMHFCTTPMPTTAPTRQWEVETGRPRAEEESTAMAPPICVANDLDGVSSVILLPTVWIVSRPIVTMPMRKPADPNTSAQKGMSGLDDTSFFSTTCRIADSGPMALPTSLPPCAHATLNAETISSGTNLFSACAISPASSPPSTSRGAPVSGCTSTLTSSDDARAMSVSASSLAGPCSSCTCSPTCFTASRCSRSSSPVGCATQCFTFSASTLTPPSVAEYLRNVNRSVGFSSFL
mmetsp:Transcript_42080/g.85922  ORF Transcript_42080/g.85922 Transcript_42080/m.85922 type:complete len:259 (+) Transcript_42080:118-894(+)